MYVQGHQYGVLVNSLAQGGVSQPRVCVCVCLCVYIQGHQYGVLVNSLAQGGVSQPRQDGFVQRDGSAQRDDKLAIPAAKAAAQAATQYVTNIAPEVRTTRTHTYAKYMLYVYVFTMYSYTM